ncbi:hypothetical protein TrRE_jg10017, partial [Triparma retinervis]
MLSTLLSRTTTLTASRLTALSTALPTTIPTYIPNTISASLSTSSISTSSISTSSISTSSISTSISTSSISTSISTSRTLATRAGTSKTKGRIDLKLLTGKSTRGIIHSLRSTGNSVSHSKRRTRRVFAPNVFKRRLYSEVLDEMVGPINVSATGLRDIDKFGGLDRYLIKNPLKRTV